MVVKAAHYYGIAPWELLERPQVWVEWAICAENAENRAVNELTREQMQAKKK
jgi:hypothetical protein